MGKYRHNLVRLWALALWLLPARLLAPPAHPEINPHYSAETFEMVPRDPRVMTSTVEKLFPAYVGCQFDIKLPKSNFSNEQFKELLFNSEGKLKVLSVDQVVPRLPQELRDRVVLAFKSESNQAKLVSATHPRVILVDTSGAFRLAYGGCKGENPPPDCETIEWQFFDPNTGKTEFRRIELPGIHNRVAHPPATAMSQSPNICLDCHGAGSGEGERTRGLLPAYNLWPFFYRSLGRDGRGAVKVGSTEYQNFKKFIEEVWPEQDVPKVPMATEVTLNARYTSLRFQGANRQEILAKLEGEPGQRIDLPFGFTRSEENAELNNALAYYDAFGIAVPVAKHPNFSKLKALIVALEVCDWTGHSIDQIANGDGSFARWKKQIETEGQEDLTAAQTEVASLNSTDFGDGVFEAFPSRYFATSDFVLGLELAKRLGLDPTELGNDRKQPYNLMRPSGTSILFFKLLTNVLKKCDPEVQKLLEDRNALCSAETLARYKKALIETPVSPPRPKPLGRSSTQRSH